MDKLVEHGIRMLEIVEGENDFFRNDAKRQADIARAVYDTILRVQVLERKADRKTENCSEKPNNCKDLQDWKDRMWAEAIVTEPQTSCKTCRYGEVDEGYVRCAYYSKSTEQDEPQTDGILFKGNLKEGDYKLIKTTDGWVLEGKDIVYCGYERSNE